MEEKKIAARYLVETYENENWYEDKSLEEYINGEVNSVSMQPGMEIVVGEGFTDYQEAVKDFIELCKQLYQEIKK